MRYYGTRPTGERYFLRRLYAGFSVGDERNAGKLALWEKRYAKQVLCVCIMHVRTCAQVLHPPCVAEMRPLPSFSRAAPLCLP